MGAVEEEEAWEALDLDDTDLLSSPFLRRCDSRLQQPSSPPSRRLLPGPAGAIQAAMHRKDRTTYPPNNNNNGKSNFDLAEISTQEYIRRVEEDSGEEFTRNPWVYALDIVRCDGGVDATPLRDIKKCVKAERFEKVVAVVKSCTPNGLGDMMVTLKDPSDTIGASVHRKIFSIGEIGRLITVGSVLILQKVVAFVSSCTACYLNITKSNVVKVISVDCEVQSVPEEMPHSTQAFSNHSEARENTTPLVSRTERTFHDVQEICSLNGKAESEKLRGKENNEASTLLGSRNFENAAYTQSTELIHVDLPDPVQKALGYKEDDSCRTIQSGSSTVVGSARNFEDIDNTEKRRQVRDFSSAPSMVENLGDREACEGNGVRIERLLKGNSSVCTTEKVTTSVDAPAGTSSSMTENLDDLGFCGANYVQKQRQNRGIYSAPSISEVNSAQKRPQMTDTEARSVVGKQRDQHKANEVKKQKVALISKTSVQEWTDEQLCGLDMDED